MISRPNFLYEGYQKSPGRTYDPTTDTLTVQGRIRKEKFNLVTANWIDPDTSGVSEDEHGGPSELRNLQ